MATVTVAKEVIVSTGMLVGPVFTVTVANFVVAEVVVTAT